jgi:hypothetical protein
LRNWIRIFASRRLRAGTLVPSGRLILCPLRTAPVRRQAQVLAVGPGRIRRIDG